MTPNPLIAVGELFHLSRELLGNVLIIANRTDFWIQVPSKLFHIAWVPSLGFPQIHPGQAATPILEPA